jgi:hypothetical protein
MLLPFLVTALAAPPVIFAAWLLHRHLTDTGRHRLAATTDPYRPRVAARRAGPPVIPGATPVTEPERRARMIAVPVPAPGWRAGAAEVATVQFDRVR